VPAHVVGKRKEDMRLEKYKYITFVEADPTLS
jgi:hypothetical protein